MLKEKKIFNFQYSMFNEEWNVEACDATSDEGSNEACFTKIFKHK